MARAAFGFTKNVREGDDTEAITKMFTPEFRNRLDAVVSFGHLPAEVVRKVVEKFILQLEAQLSERQVNIEISAEAADWLAVKGYDQQMGARPLARVIQEHIKKPLAEELLFGKLKDGGTVRILKKDDGLAFDYLSRDDEKALPKLSCGGEEARCGEEGCQEACGEGEVVTLSKLLSSGLVLPRVHCPPFSPNAVSRAHPFSSAICGRANETLFARPLPHCTDEFGCRRR
jgi:C-terminal, D2-small domain, of ClpB protein